MEEEFQATTQEITFYSRRNLEDLKDEATRLKAALRKCQENEKILVLKCQYLNEEIDENKRKVEEALKLGQQDQDTIVALTKELENAWNLFDKSFEREKLAKEVIKSLKIEIGQLTKLCQNLTDEFPIN